MIKSFEEYLGHKPKIGYFCNFLNEVDGLANHMIKMNHLDFDARIYIDGKFPGFKHEGFVSNDGSLDILKKIPKVTLLSPGREISEMEKNNMAFKTAADLGIDLLIQVDADEWIDFDRETLIESFTASFETIGTFQFFTRFTNHYSSPPRIVNFLPRLFFKPEFITCDIIHWWYFALGRRITSDSTSFVEGAHVHHDDRVRSSERNDLMDKYQEVNMVREQGIINKHNKERGMIIESHKCKFEHGYMMGRKCIVCNREKQNNER